MSLSRWRLRVQMASDACYMGTQTADSHPSWISPECEAERGSHDDGREDERHDSPPSDLKCAFHGVCPSDR
jgi:hypothetical protein